MSHEVNWNQEKGRLKQLGMKVRKIRKAIFLTFSAIYVGPITSHWFACRAISIRPVHIFYFVFPYSVP